jgi:hypothetical protein
MRTSLAVSGLALLTALVLSGCGSDQPSIAKADPTAAPSPTAPPGLKATAPAKPANQSDSAESAVKYGGYFVALVQYAVRTRSIRPVAGEAFDQASCSTCRQLGTYITKLVDGGYWEIGDDIEVGTLVAKPTRDDIRVSGPFTYPAVKYVTVDGKQKSTETSKKYRFSANLSWDEPGNRWRVLDYDFLRKGNRG